MKILAIDTASKICSVAILENDDIIDEVNLDNGQTHSENLMPMVAKILEKNHVTLADFELLSCCIGPGSFTGIRIGVASVKAMAEVAKLPVIGVNSLETLAKLDTSPKLKISLIDARNHQVYCGIFDNKCEPLQELIADDIFSVIKILKKYKDFVCIGDAAILYKTLLQENFPRSRVFG